MSKKNNHYNYRVEDELARIKNEIEMYTKADTQSSSYVKKTYRTLCKIPVVGSVLDSFTKNILDVMKVRVRN